MFNRWLYDHKFFGGKIYRIPDVRKIVTDPMPAYYELCEKYRNVPLEEVELFVSTDVYDNNMPNRDILEDGSKIYHLTKNKIKFLPQLVHEPWSDRWRVHPGSGRLVALWMQNKAIPAIYIYFNESDFEIPADAKDITYLSQSEIEQQLVFGKNFADEICWDIYPAFGPKSHVKDAEWNPPGKFEWCDHWHFARYSEGTNFGKYKRAWRDDALEFWFSLNS